MSNYKKITRHPNGNYAIADWIDDYFGNHLYAVKFDNDSRYWPVDLINKVKLKEFWAADVIKSLQDFFGVSDPRVIEVLDNIGSQYEARWKRDPDDGEGAIENEEKKRAK